MGPLYKKILAKNGPYGKGGKVMWLCAECAKMADAWEAIKAPTKDDEARAIAQAEKTLKARGPMKKM